MNLAVIGAGAIGSSVVKGLLKSGYEGRMTATRRQVETIKELERLGVNVTSDNIKAAREAGIIILCVKPKDVEKVLKEIRSEICGKLVISMAAAIGLKFLEKTAPEAKFIRAMPNMAILVQASFTAYSIGSRITDEDKAIAEKLLNLLGKTVWVDERCMDAITALSGCAPAYISVILEAMTYAGFKAGLSNELALAASAQSMIGTGRLVLEAGKTPSEVKDMVTTPGGITAEGLRELEKIPIRHAFMSTIEAAAGKSRKISDSLTKGNK